jgi:hypothetical protein
MNLGNRGDFITAFRPKRVNKWQREPLGLRAMIKLLTFMRRTAERWLLTTTADLAIAELVGGGVEALALEADFCLGPLA